MPDFRHSTPASAATFGRLSKITATTPSGTRTRSMVMPFGRCQLSVTAPTGSAMSWITRMPSAIACTRASVRVSRSIKADVAPLARTSATSSALAARIAGAPARIARSMAASARFFCSVGATANARAAARALRARSFIRTGRSADPSMAFSEAVMRGSNWRNGTVRSQNRDSWEQGQSVFATTRQRCARGSIAPRAGCRGKARDRPATGHAPRDGSDTDRAR